MYRMSPPSYIQNKKHIYKWREQNKERHREIDLKSKRWKKVQMIFFQILLN